jgi:preprotein translocase subunit SecG
MLYGLLLTMFVILCFLLVLLVLMQKGKGSIGIGNLGGGTQMLFGGSGGQDLFQKITWVLGAIFMLSSLGLALMSASSSRKSRYVTQSKQAKQAEAAVAIPVEAQAQPEPQQ